MRSPIEALKALNYQRNSIKHIAAQRAELDKAISALVYVDLLHVSERHQHLFARLGVSNG